ncbi:sodium/bile acid cotransporter 5-like isoform X1 [Cimex lectularius]|uniref:Uncharacterized protein n=2 Tax=Cimex lectularius TaxID=79782 RepID=A0A8I6S382_CIMLE|nr:sodium/bile acid cotransporter 5-like isoform X1 [Cimex lectularius]
MEEVPEDQAGWENTLTPSERGSAFSLVLALEEDSSKTKFSLGVKEAKMMCPLWPLHIVLMYLMALCPLWYVTCQIVAKASKFSAKFTPGELSSLYMQNSQTVGVSTRDLSDMEIKNSIIRAIVSDQAVAYVPDSEVIFTKSKEDLNDIWNGSFNITGNFLGFTSVKICVTDKNGPQNVCTKMSDEMKVKVLRKPRFIDHVFTGSVIILVSVIFINFGCALDVNSLKQAILRPIGPLIGLLSHFLFLPLISFGLGELLFPGESGSSMRLGLFFTGISPAGGASNIWTYSLGGNLNLSVTMTAVSTLASFVMIPLWVFTLGPVIFSKGTMGVPYTRILTSGAGLIIPLTIGYIIQRNCKRLSAIMVRILKPFSALLIIFIVVFATVTNMYLFQLFSWEIIIAGIGLPFLGYLAGLISGKLFRQPPEDVLAISIETGVQNTGIAIFLLKFCLPQPLADLTTVIPVCVALMTPLPLLILLAARKILFAESKKEKVTTSTDDTLPCLEKLKSPNTRY